MWWDRRNTVPAWGGRRPIRKRSGRKAARYRTENPTERRPQERAAVVATGGGRGRGGFLPATPPRPLPRAPPRPAVAASTPSSWAMPKARCSARSATRSKSTTRSPSSSTLDPHHYDLLVVDGDQHSTDYLRSQPLIERFVTPSDWILAFDVSEADHNALDDYTGFHVSRARATARCSCSGSPTPPQSRG